MSDGDPFEFEIAIVGLAGRFPGAPDIETFWRNLREGVESIRDLTDHELRTAGVDDETLRHPRYVRRAADLEGADLFDAALFGFTPREAQYTDPQFRVFLEDAWTALEDAGRLGDAGERRVGVFAGASAGTYLAHSRIDPATGQTLGAFQISLGNERDYLASQISYRLDLHGPSLVVQTACSTSLVAVHLACQSLLNRECDLALAGGVSITVPQTEGYLYEEGDIASPDGHCRAFDADAAGCVKGNGSGVVVLRRLSDAVRDGDPIRAVIKGTAINNDGSLKIGFTAPSVQGQSGVIAEALAVAGVDAASLDYVEAHGTGTTLGDPIEVSALVEAFRASTTTPEPGDPTPEDGRCALGSAKTNIGHLDAAAGIAGLIKAVLALQHRQIPPSLHFVRPNPKIGLETSPFYVNAELRDWTARETPRRAGVSSFGIGGTNAHVVLEEAPTPARPVPSETEPRTRLLVLSAASETALETLANRLAAHLESASDLDLADVAYTLQVGRRRLPWRRAVAARSVSEAASLLRGDSGNTASRPAGGRVEARCRRDERRQAEVAFLFPGQGAQHPDMVRVLYRSEPLFRKAFDACCDIFEPLIACDLRVLAAGAAHEGAGSKQEDGRAERLRHTAVTQPALFAVEYALAQLWIGWGVAPSTMAGHSIGEYVAACLAGVMSLGEAAELVAERGRLMGELPGGSMLAVRLDEAAVRAHLRDEPELSLAVVNGPAACVVAGPTPVVHRVRERWDAAGIPCTELHTSHAFHSSMMDPALAAFETRVRAVRLQAPTIPFLSNLSGTWITEAQATDPLYWVRHLRETVRFSDNLAVLAEDPARICLEVGPGNTLTGLLRQAHPGITGVASLVRARAAGDAVQGEAADDHRSVLRALAELWCAGVDLDPEAIHVPDRPRRVALPTYPFERARYWIDAGIDGGAGAKTRPGVAAEREVTGTEEGASKNPDLSAWFFAPGWRRSVFPIGATDTDGAHADSAAGDRASPDSGAWMIFDDGSPLARGLADAARRRGHLAVLVRAPNQESPEPEQDTRPGDQGGKLTAEVPRVLTWQPADPGAFATHIRSLREEGVEVTRVLHLWCTQPDAPGDAQARGFHSLIAALQGLHQFGGSAELRLAVLTQGLFDVVGDTVTQPERATMVGICRVAPQEYPGLRCRILDLDGSGTGAVEAILRELDAPDHEPVVAHRGGHRWIPSYTPLSLEAPVGAPSPSRGLPEGAAVLLTGGFGPFELALAQRLVHEGARAVAFVDPEATLAADAPADLATAIEALHAAGVDLVARGGVSARPGALRDLVDEIRSRFGRLDLLVHTPGLIGGGMIQLKTRDEIDRVFAPRLETLDALLAGARPGERVVTVSSAISVAGVFGQVDYCGASAYLDARAQAHAAQPGPKPRLLSLDFGMAFWDRWQQASGPGGDALMEQLRAIQAELGITIDEGVEAFCRALAVDLPQLVVVPQDIDDLVAQSLGGDVGAFLEGVGETLGTGATGRHRSTGDFETDTEAQVAAVWTDLLGVESIGRHDNFFEIGGNSLLAIQLASQLRRAFEIDLTIASLFESADLASLAGAVDAALDERRTAEEVARLLDEIESLSEAEIRSELARGGVARNADPSAPGRSA